MCAAPGGIAAADKGETQPVIVKLLTYDVQVGADGLSTDTIHSRIEAANAASATDVGQEPIRYSASMESVEVIEAYTLKADGRKLPVSPGSIYEQPAPGSPQMPMFDDQRQKVIVFPDVQAGDSVDYTYRYVRKLAPMPGAYSLVMPFSRRFPYEDVRVTLTAPKSYPLVVRTHELQFQKHESATDVTYSWRYSNPNPSADEAAHISPLAHTPRLLVSSFADFDALGHAYASIVAPMTNVTEKVKKAADDITRGAGDHRAQAQKIYDWVSRHIRYVAVEIGQAAIVPHDADTVLANGYGDCKDHAVLFAALLKAKGIDGKLALIDYGDEYELPDAAIVGAFNHVILWIPELQMFADTTSGVAPFGGLSFGEYGKPVVLAAASGPTVAQTPLLPPGVATASVKTAAKLDESGRLTGHNIITGTGPYAIMLRGLGLAIQGVGEKRMVADMLSRAGMPGSGSYSIPSPDQLESDYVVTADFTLGPFSDLLDGRRFSMPTGLSLMGPPGSFLMGPLADRKISDSEPTICYSGNETEDISLEAPRGRRFLSLPPDTNVSTANLSFAAHWSLDGQTVTLHREFTSRVGSIMCSDALRKETAAALAKVRASYDYGVALSKELSSTDQKLLDLISNADAALKKRDLAGAERAYTDALATSGITPKLAGATRVGRAGVYIAEGKYGEGIADYEEAIGLDPALAPKFAELARALEHERQFGIAETILTRAIAADPNSAPLYDQRGDARDSLGNHAGAVEDFGKAIELAGPGDNLAGFYNDRATAYGAERDWVDSIADADQAIRRDAKLADAYRVRAMSEYYSGKVDRAVSDFSQAADLDPKDPYHALWLYLAEKRSGKDASADLRRRAGALDLTKWPGAVIQVAMGTLRPEAIVLPAHEKVWETKRDECERDFYLGEFALLSGDTAAASRFFHAALGTDIKEYVEYIAASAELERIGT